MTVCRSTGPGTRARASASGRICAAVLGAGLVSTAPPVLADDAPMAAIGMLGGTWDVATTLVTASAPVNQGYRAGDHRVERWAIRQMGGELLLTSQAGTIPGRMTSMQSFGFQGMYDTGMGIHTVVRISGRFASPVGIFGTINADYLSSQFGHKIGMDAWTFEARRTDGY